MRRLGDQLRKLREEAGLTLDGAAALVQHSKSTLSRIETAQVVARSHDVEYILWKYGVTDERLRDSLIGLAQGGRKRGWWQSYSGLTALNADSISLEQDSARIRGFHPIVVPGLLQTPGYARALMRGVPPLPGTDIERGVALRTARQEILTKRDPADLDVVLDESVILRRLGGGEVLREQLRHVQEMAQRENVTVRVLPLDAEAHAAPMGAFEAMDVIGGNFTVVFLESLGRASFVEDDAEVARCIVTFDSLCSLALPASESLGLIEQTLRAL
jgi:transcriptional regulator with XRE-family HTH domain